MFVVGDVGGEGDVELAIGVEDAILLFDLVAVLFVVTLVEGADLVCSVIPERVIVSVAIDRPLDFGAVDRLAEIIAGVDGGLDGFAFEHVLFSRV